MSPSSASESSSGVSAIDARDLDTPDDWIPRHPELIRLTGRHPFNCEPPPDKLTTFTTPTELHFVRNHGAVPRTAWGAHTLTIDGLVDTPTSFSMEELTTRFDEHVVSLPVLVVCSGNRRKEQNMLKKTIGFSWGVGAAANATYTGVPLHVLLEHCGVDRARARHVWVEGADSLVDGKGYGTSIPAHTALDATCDVLVAWEMNGAPLSPDHGFPLRIIVPGHVGGRMVKWLAKITVSDVESSNHYHIHDNRLLPSHIDAETATAENWWSRPEFAIQELNVNSVVLAPAHGEQLDLAGDDVYTVRGYAYSGGGRKVIRVELTLDDGVSWRDATIRYTEKPNAAGKMWCWVHYELAVPVATLARAKEICVRAWDASMNTQPALPTWNVMGMMNNPWFRVRVHGGGSTKALTFEHPTQAGALKGGWMTADRIERADEKTTEQVAAPGAAPAESAPSTSVAQQKLLLADKAKSLPVFTHAEVAKHNSRESCWFICHGLVFDATPYLDTHPGGAASILLCAGTDCTDEFESIHSAKAWQMLAPYVIGRCDGDVATTSAPSAVSDKRGVTSETRATAKTSQGPLARMSQQIKRRMWRMFAPCGVTLPTDDGDDLSTSGESSDETMSDYEDDDSNVALRGAAKVPLVLIEKQIVSRDARIFRFALPAKHLQLGLPVGNHVLLYATIEGKTVVRAYTPISDSREPGFVSFLIKVYFAGEHPAYPEGGRFSQFLDELHLGSRIQMRGPLGHFTYQGRGECSLGDGAHATTKRVKKLGFVAGGTGITPIYQILREILTAPDDTTQVALVYCVKSERDLLLRDELDALQQLKPAQCRVFYTLTELSGPDESPAWAYGRSRVTTEMVREVIGADADHVALCGPPGLLEHACLPALKQLGYDCAAQVTQL